MPGSAWERSGRTAAPVRTDVEQAGIKPQGLRGACSLYCFVVLPFSGAEAGEHTSHHAVQKEGTSEPPEGVPNDQTVSRMAAHPGLN